MTARDEIIELKRKYILEYTISPYGSQFMTIDGKSCYISEYSPDEEALLELKEFLKDKPIPKKRIGTRMISKCCGESTISLSFKNNKWIGICSKCNKETEFVADSKYYF